MMSAKQFNTVVKAPTLDFDRLDEKSKKTLLSRLDSFELSVRTRNVLFQERLRVLGEIVQIREIEWRRFRNCGTRTLCELESLVSRFGLTLGTEIINFPNNALELSEAFDPAVASYALTYSSGKIIQAQTYPAEINFDHARKGTQAWLVEILKGLDFSVRAQNIFLVHGLNTIADLILRSEAELLRMPNCGRKTVKEIKTFLSQCGLVLNTKVHGLDQQTASELQAKLRHQGGSARELEDQNRFGDVLDAASSLEEELLSILEIETSDRNVERMTKLWGWFGKKPRTLESVGGEYGLTRERVRQIAAKVTRRIRKRKLVTPFVVRGARHIRQSCPATAQTLRAGLQEANISKVGVHPLGLAKACEILEIPLGLDVLRFGGTQVFLIKEIEMPLRTFEIEARRRTSANGCVNFLALCD